MKKSMHKLFSYEETYKPGQLKIPAGEVYQIAELSIIKSSEIKEHVQTCDEITYAVSGKARIYSGNRTFDISKGQIHFLKKGQSHKIVADSNQNFHYYCTGFLLDPSCKDTESFIYAAKNLDSFLIDDRGDVKTLFGLLIKEFFIHDEESAQMIHYCLCQILVTLCRLLKGSAAGASGKLMVNNSSNAVYRALKYIDEEYLSITNVRQVAQALSYSEYYLSHVFKAKMNMTIKEYLIEKKILTAIELLRHSNMSVSEISELLNFSSLHSFGQVFRRHMNMSASEFRKAHAKPDESIPSIAPDPPESSRPGI